jgi:hypothetical protein
MAHCAEKSAQAMHTLAQSCTCEHGRPEKDRQESYGSYGIVVVHRKMTPLASRFD